ncbi:KAP family NTPase [Phytobacter diazotrophicus]|uniref:KAP family P-loop NTPase fold protein n=1 Tax=Phytobacter diazotrophicus TaxID=395631 RepID=UPI001C99D3A3|nr:P-loop NTPase fold protein [Phytobacter diazotrophicus]MBY6255164.1 KAP family NTPase [Phytobacter diazotrophicus]
MSQTSAMSPGIRLGQPITRFEDDRYSANEVARHLARSVLRLGREGSAVIGIEAPWGSGKSSLLNLLELQLQRSCGEKDNIITLSPWLNGDSFSPVGSLLLPVAAIVEKYESAKYRKRKKIAETTLTIFQYIQATSRLASPFAELAARIPGVPDISAYTRALGKLDLSGRKPTAAELRSRIARRIEELDLSFVILIDDLDRLEPLQAAEVIRVVKSVADFPRFRYVLSYDRDILASALSTALQVEDGLAYLQKIIQLPFSLPRPETFRLQETFIQDAIAVYLQVNGEEPDEKTLSGIIAAATVYGVCLSTPRMVDLTINALRFRYPDVRDYVWFPDLCLLQLIRVTNARFHDWIEHYLSEYAVVVTRQGGMSEEEASKMSEALQKCLELYGKTRASSPWELKKWLPGIQASKDQILLFETGDSVARESMADQKRLGSHLYWRYYFAFSAPQNVLPPAYLDGLLQRFAQPGEFTALATEMLSKIKEISISSFTWYEHILSELTASRINSLSYESCSGLLHYFFNYNDDVVRRFQMLGRWLDRHDTPGKAVVLDLLRRMLKLRRRQSLAQLQRLFCHGQSWSWPAQFMRDLLWGHGMRGGRAWPADEQFLAKKELDVMRMMLSGRMSSSARKNQLFMCNDLGGYLYAWGEIDSRETVKTWIQSVVAKDDGFLNLLLIIRGEAYSSVHGPYLSLDLERLSDLLGSSEIILQRLETLHEKKYLPEMTNDIMNSVRLSRGWGP